MIDVSAYEKNLCIICHLKYLCTCFFSDKIPGDKVDE